TNLGQDVAIKHNDHYHVDEVYAIRGVHSQAINRCNGAKIALTQQATRTTYTLEVRAYNDGVAFRWLVPGDKLSRTPDEATAFTLPGGSTVWYHDFKGHYEGVHTKKNIAEVAAGDWAAVPLTFKLANNLGYASITEAALMNYSGMGLQSAGHRVFA